MMEKLNSPQDYPDGKLANRRLARIVVFQVLYQEELNPGSWSTAGYAYITQELPKLKPLVEFADNLLEGAMNHRDENDVLLENLSQHWSLSRMNPTDRSLLRLAVYEITATETPKAVVINEYIELAKKFGTADSPAFINGILDKIDKNSSSILKPL